MELRHLRYFTAVAENLSFRRAADRLHLTRPALSKQIKELEEELGVRLLDRTTTRVTLTPAGVVYLQEARRILEQTERATGLAREAAAGHRGQLILGEPGVLGLAFLTPVLTTFREQFPHVEVTLRELPPVEHVGAVESGEVQVGFVVGPPPSTRGALDSLAVLKLQVGAALPKSHPLARRAAISPQELIGQPLICIGEPAHSEHAQYVRERFRALELPRPRVRTVASIRSLMTMVASGHGISLLPDVLAAQAAGTVVVVPLTHAPDFAFEVFAIWRRREPEQIVRNFLSVLAGIGKKEPRKLRPADSAA